MRAILVSIKTKEKKEKDVKNSLNELEGLVKAVGGKTLGKLYQIKEHPDPSTYIGKGKAIQIRELAEGTNADTVVVDAELSPVQIRNLEDITEVNVLDRTDLILDIFKKRAKTKQAKLQVELAMLTHLLPRVYGEKGKELSRIGGRGKTKGAGEKIGEIKVRDIKRRISKIKRELKEIEKNKREQRKKRNKDPNILKVALIGYTNVGKSSLLKRLTKRETFISNQLFATLDTKTSFISFPDINKKVLITDTVGFVKDMPKELMDAFLTTLKEIEDADLLIYVVDISDNEWEEKLKEVDKIIKNLNLDNKDSLILLNKIDKLIPDKTYLEDDLTQINGKPAIIISTEKGWNLDKLFDFLREKSKSLNFRR